VLFLTLEWTFVDGIRQYGIGTYDTGNIKVAEQVFKFTEKGLPCSMYMLGQTAV
jgi:hypothetical protein